MRFIRPLLLVVLASVLSPSSIARAQPVCGGADQPACNPYAAATYHGKAGCPAGQFADMGVCYSCPSGYKAAALVTVKARNKCFRPAYQDFAKPQKLSGPGPICEITYRGSYGRPGKGCYKCPGGYRPNLNDPNSDKGCDRNVPEKHAPAVEHGRFPCNQGFHDIGRNECWSCPSGYKREINLFPINDPRACTRQICKPGLQHTHKRRCDDSGNCFLAYKQDWCEQRGSCGGEGARPCFVWERIPSCNPGLREDFTRNLCVRLRPGESPFLAGLESFGNEVSNIQESCKKAIYEGDLWKSVKAPASVPALPMMSIASVDPECTRQTVGASVCQAAFYIPDALEDLATIPKAAGDITKKFEKWWDHEDCMGRKTEKRRATSVGRGSLSSCDTEKGEFWDMKDGGGCWQCPDGFERSWSAVDKADACVTSSDVMFIARGVCAYSQALFRETAEAGMCMAKLLSKGEIASLSKSLLGRSRGQPWNSFCSVGAEIGTTMAIDAAIAAAMAAASGGGTAGSSAATTTAKATNSFRKFMKAADKAYQRIHDVAGVYNTLQPTVASVAECRPLQSTTEASATPPTTQTRRAPTGTRAQPAPRPQTQTRPAPTGASTPRATPPRTLPSPPPRTASPPTTAVPPPAVSNAAVPTRGHVRIRNRWKTDQALNVEHGALQSGTFQPGWHSAMWTIEPVPGGAFVRLRNRWKSDQYLHIENGRIESGPIEPGWWSAMWILDRDGGYTRIRNRWKNDQYLHVERGSVESGPIEPGWWSAMWILEPVR